MPALKRTDPCVSDLALDRALSDELPPAARRELRAHLADCVRCSIRYDALRRQRAAFLAQAPDWDAFVAHQNEPRRGSWFRWTAWSALAASALLAVLVLDPFSPATDPMDRGERAKGAPSIGFYVKRGERVLRGVSGDVVYPGDVLRFSYSSEQGAYFALFDADRAGASVFYPAAPSSAPIEPGRDRALDFAIELDAQLGTERVFGVFCEAPIELEPVRVALQTSRTLPSLPGCRVDTLVLQKRSR